VRRHRRLYRGYAERADAAARKAKSQCTAAAYYDAIRAQQQAALCAEQAGLWKALNAHKAREKEYVKKVEGLVKAEEQGLARFQRAFGRV
jgi:hypothetical protein